MKLNFLLIMGCLLLSSCTTSAPAPAWADELVQTIAGNVKQTAQLKSVSNK